jgi:transglutaminase superfamily protein
MFVLSPEPRESRSLRNALITFSCLVVFAIWFTALWELGAFDRRDGRALTTPSGHPGNHPAFDFGPRELPEDLVSPPGNVESPLSGQRPEQDDAGNLWPAGQRIELSSVSDGEVLIDARQARLRMTYTIGHADAGRRAVEFVTRIPASIAGRLAVVNARFDPEPSGIYEASGGRYAVYHWSAGVRDAEIRQEFEIEVSDVAGLRRERSEFNLETGTTTEAWLSSEEHIEVEDEAVAALAKTLRRIDRRRTLAAIADEVTSRLQPASRRGARGAAHLLAHRVPASRIGYCDLFVALARAAGIPARAVEGFATEAGEDHYHWVEVYMPRRGWRIIDPWAIEAGEADLDRLRGLRVPLAFRTQDPHLGGYHICYLHGAAGSQLQSWRDFNYRYRLQAIN